MIVLIEIFYQINRFEYKFFINFERVEELFLNLLFVAYSLLKDFAENELGRTDTTRVITEDPSGLKRRSGATDILMIDP